MLAQPPVPARVIIVGVGNELLGDEGLGVHVARGLAAHREKIPEHVEVIDAGSSLLDVLLERGGGARVIIVDAMCAGGGAGTVYRLEIDCNLSPDHDVLAPLSLHQGGVLDALRAAALAGAAPRQVTVIGAEPKNLDPGCKLSAELTRAAQRIIALLAEEVAA